MLQEPQVTTYTLDELMLLTVFTNAIISNRD